MRFARLLPLAALALVAVAAVAIGGPGGTSQPKDQRDTRCWGCHVAYTIPLKDFTLIIPPNQADFAPGAQDAYSVRVKNGYVNEITFTSVTLDLRNAPSLRFGDAPADIVDQVHNGTIGFTSGRPTSNRHSGNVTLQVPEGAAKVGLCIRTGYEPPPILQLDLFAGNASQPIFTGKAAAPGGDVCVPDEVAARLGSGNLTAVASYIFPDPANPAFAPPVSMPFDAVLNVKFGADGAIQQLSSTKLIPKRQDQLFNFRLAGAGVPAPHEVAIIVVNTTVHYDHKDAGPTDWENVTTRKEVPVVPDGAGGARLEPVRLDIPSPTGPAGAPLTRISEAIGYVSAFLLVASIWSGGMFGKASRRSLNDLFEGAKRRVAFHNFLSYGLTAAALVHTLIFLLRFTRDYQWTLGIIWGGLAILAMLGLGLTGALQIPIVRKWNYGTWKWTHWWMSIAAIVFTIVHMLLDGANFVAVQDWLGWEDPFLPDDGVGVR